jgi:FkbM family methyltransferase
MKLFAKLSYLNIFRKFFVFLKYFIDNLNNAEFRMIGVGLKYLIFHTPNSTNRKIKTNNGIFFIRKNTIDFKLANSAYEFLVTRKFRKLLPNYELFIDIGANIGTYSIIAAQQGIKTLAFEPIQSNYDSLLKNIQLNQSEELIKPFMYGLGLKKEQVKFNFYQLKPGASSKHPLKKKSENIEVQIEVFDKLELIEVKQSKSILIKIDVEGMEIEVVQGMEELLRSDKNICMIIESKHSGIKNLTNLLNKFSKFKFEQIDEFNMLAIKIA